MTDTDKYMLKMRAWRCRREQLDHVSSAILKLELMGLTPATGMVECQCPVGIHPSRWTAMVKQAWKQVKE